VILGDTIAAIATAPGLAGVAVVRVSGSDAFSIAARLTGVEIKVGRVQYVHLSVDDCVLISFRSPRSYTGEDVVEFQCHGGIVTPRRVLSLCLAHGARLAERGEFTERALLNGKLDYASAEAVLDLIHARTDRAADRAREGLSGRVREEVRGIYDEAISLSSRMEYSLDVDVEEFPHDFIPGVISDLSALKGRLAAAIRHQREGRLLRDGATVVLAGPPNAGKSSLMNALLRENRAIVSSTPGTTRDTIEEWLDLDGWPIRLIDTAGLRETTDEIESEGVRRAREIIDRADLVLGLDCDIGLRLHAKCDLSRGEGLNISSKTGEGLEELKRTIVMTLERLAESGELSHDDSATGYLSALLKAQSYLESSVLDPASPDLVLLANAVRKVAQCLGRELGATYSEDLLDRLFSRFCVGK